MTGAPLSREQFLQNLTDSGLYTADDLHQVLASIAETGESDGEALARRLVHSEQLTPYQADALLKGRRTDLRIGAYDVLDLLGRGAMGTVYKARHRTMKRVAAVKVLTPDVARGGSFAQRFQREVETLAQLSHPNVVMAYDAGQSSAGPFLAMEFVQGRDLASEVKASGYLSVADASDCILQAARGLGYAHSRGLVHRDVKPANLIRDTHGVVKLADLGLARMEALHAGDRDSDLTQSGSFVGTVDFMSPEQAIDSSAVDHQADIYSLGCTLYFLLTGRPMYSGKTLMAILLKHGECPPPSLREARADVPEVLNAIYLRMVAKKPDDRHATMAEVIKDLEEAGPTLRALGLSARTPRGGSSPAANPLPLPSAGPQTDHGPDLAQRDTLGATSSPSPTLSGPVASPSSPPKAPPDSGPRSASRLPGRHRGVPVAVAALGAALILGAMIWGQFSRRQGGGEQAQSAQSRPPEPPAKPGPFTGVILNGGGSTFVDPLMQHWVSVYETTHGVRIDYQAVGSSRGLDGMLNRVYQFGCSDAPLSDQQRAQVKRPGSDVAHVPLVLGAVVLTYNLPGMPQGKLRLTGPILADMYLGKITRWNDPAVQIANPGVPLPNLAISPVHRADSSGTSFIWTEYLSSVSGEWKTRIGTGMTLEWPCGLAAAGNQGVANQVSRGVGSVGYVELTFALENNLPQVAVKNRAGRFVTANLPSVTAAAGALTDIPADLRLPLIDAAGADTYPIVGMTYALVYTDQTGNPSGRELVAFLRWGTHEGQAYVKELGYAPLPPELVQRIDTTLAAVKLAPP
jgi:phosphate ABC transporter phosphate-binding protein